MKRGMALFVMAVVAITLVVPLSDISDGASANDNNPADTTTIYGYVADVALDRNNPLRDVQVSVLDSGLVRVASCITDEDGYFELSYKTGSGVYLRFECDGYTIRGVPFGMTMVEGSPDTVSFTLPQKADEDGKYMVTTGVDEGSPVLMRLTSGSIFGYVYGFDGVEKYGLRGASVTLESSAGQSYTAYTNDSGYFEVDCRFGTYTMKIQCKGFEDVTVTGIEVGDGSQEAILREKSHSFIWNLNTPHAMEVIGIVLIALIAVLGLLIHYMSRDGSEPILLDDMSRTNEDDDGDIRRP